MPEGLSIQQQAAFNKAIDLLKTLIVQAGLRAANDPAWVERLDELRGLKDTLDPRDHDAALAILRRYGPENTKPA